MQSRAASVADVELPVEIGLDETRSFTVGCRQACVLHESDEIFLPESVLASLPGRLGVCLGSAGYALLIVQLGG